MSIELRGVGEDEYSRFTSAMAVGFGEEMTDDMMAARAREMRHGRVLAAYDGADIVGTSVAYPLAMNIPEGLSAPVAVVADVTALPTHRRRGILTRMMRRMLTEARDDGQILAALGASESIIYGRFGYGAATHNARWRIDRRHTAFAAAPEWAGKTRFIGKDDALTLLPEVSVRACADRPGFVALRHEHWAEHLADFEAHRRGSGAMQFVVYEEPDGRIDGYVAYRIRGEEVIVVDFMSVTDAAHAALWAFCFGIDLRTAIACDNRPTDDPMPWMLADPRRLERWLQDCMWLRIVDARAALEARRYAVEGRLRIELRDDFCGWNVGRYALEGGPDGARCVPTAEPADITLSAAELGAAYLGGAAFSALAHASRVEGDADALRLADAMFRTRRAAWWPHEL